MSVSLALAAIVRASPVKGIAGRMSQVVTEGSVLDTVTGVAVAVVVVVPSLATQSTSTMSSLDVRALGKVVPVWPASTTPLTRHT
jgi:hypothetical protein